jgi:predicted aspartyl protease
VRTTLGSAADSRRVAQARHRPRFSGYPELSVASRHASTVRGEFRDGHLFIPVFINGESGKYILDTGANLSTLTELEAKRLGLRVSDLNVDPAQIGESSGKGVEGAKFAVADRLELAGIHLRNVPFLIVSDEPEAFFALPPGYRGAIGIQVLLACRTVRWDSNGTVHLDGEPRRKSTSNSNLCFNGLDTFTQVAFEKGTLDIQVDTGADSSSLFQRFASRYPEYVQGSGAPGTKVVGGAGGTTKVAATILPEIALRSGGFAATLRPVYVIAKDVESDGTIGMDILGQAHEVTFDFRAMRLTLSK